MLFGAPAVGALIALWGFWILLCIGWIRGDLGPKGSAIAILFWLAGLIGLKFFLYGLLFPPYVALLDIALVFRIAKGDVRLI